MFSRNKTRKVYCGNVAIGGDAPVSIQSMTNVSARNYEALMDQIKALHTAGCQIVRLAVPDEESLKVFKRVCETSDMPVVADIHFDYRLAIGAIEAGASKIRINPGNIGSKEKIRAVVDAASERNVPIRVGVNSGSLEQDIIRKYGVSPEGICESGLKNCALIEDMGYGNLVLSLKSSNVADTYSAYLLASEKTDIPLHIGVTEAGTIKSGILKSAVGLGGLLLRGIGNTMRVSLTADPVQEIYAAKDILKACGLIKEGPNLISCPTCGRTAIDLFSIAKEVEEIIHSKYADKEITVAVMGCAVNGPGEAKEADFGIAGGKGVGLIFSKGEIIKKVEENKLKDELFKLIDEYFEKK